LLCDSRIIICIGAATADLTTTQSDVLRHPILKELITHGGKASIRKIASAFLARDQSQLEYYEQITKSMPGKVLAEHGIVERLGDEYRLTVDPSLLSLNQRDELIRLCDEMVRTYMEKQGAAAAVSVAV
jgi:ATP adenylyltransferase